MPRLTWVFAGCTITLLVLSCRGSFRDNFPYFFIKSYEPPHDKTNKMTVRPVFYLCWGLTSQSTIFQSCRDGAIASWVINQYFRGVKCLAQGHNTAVEGFEPPTSRSRVRHSTTEPPRSPRPVWSESSLSAWRNTGWSESSLGTQINSLVLSWWGSFYFHQIPSVSLAINLIRTLVSHHMDL